MRIRTLLTHSKRKLPPSITITPRAQQRIDTLIRAANKKHKLAVRLSVANDWGSYTGFSYTLQFVNQDENQQTDDELITCESGAIVYVDRKALWAGEGGLLGATVDLDHDLNLEVRSKEQQLEKDRSSFLGQFASARAKGSKEPAK